MQIYNDNIFDLLQDRSRQYPLVVKQAEQPPASLAAEEEGSDSQAPGVVVSGLSECEPPSPARSILGLP